MQKRVTGIFRKQTAWRLTLSLLAILLLVLHEPALANKFETISGGISGSSQTKTAWLKDFLLVAGGISLFSALLAVVVPHDNALFLNSRNWKQSAAILLFIAMLLFGAALLV